MSRWLWWKHFIVNKILLSLLKNINWDGNDRRKHPFLIDILFSKVQDCVDKKPSAAEWRTKEHKQVFKAFAGKRLVLTANFQHVIENWSLFEIV